MRVFFIAILVLISSPVSEAGFSELYESDR
jgi:hypothetical protein